MSSQKHRLIDKRPPLAEPIGTGENQIDSGHAILFKPLAGQAAS
jgi:hypothetical protein